MNIRILKLHGSLNWQVRTRAHQPSEHDLFPLPGRTASLRCIANEQVSVTLRTSSARRTYKLMPQIVPPIYDKQGIIAAQFGGLWEAASLATSDAEYVTMIGYSIPPADAHAANMLKQAIRKNSNLERIVVVNPDPHVAARLADLTDLPEILWTRSLAQLVDEMENSV